MKLIRVLNKNNKYIFTTLNLAVKDKELKNLDIRVLLCLVSYNGRKVIKPSLKTISKDIGNRNNSISSISNSLQRLKERGYISIKRGFQKPNIYFINKIKKENPEMKPETEKSELPGEPQKELSETEVIKQAEEEITKGYITQIAFTIADYRNEITETDKKPKPQIYKFINRVLNSYSDISIKKYRISFMLLHYVLIAGKDKFSGGLPYSYFNSFFPMLYYSDFRNKIFNTNQIKQTEQYKLRPKGEENYYL